MTLRDGRPSGLLVGSRKGTEAIGEDNSAVPRRLGKCYNLASIFLGSILKTILWVCQIDFVRMS